MIKWILLFIVTCFVSCSSENKKSINDSTENKTDTTEIIKSFIYGLWSMDTGNALSNEGFYFKPDGSVDFVAAESTGEWEMMNNDSLKIIYPGYFEPGGSTQFKIDSITDGRMILTSTDGSHLFRKIPFGMNNEGVVLQGFSGQIESGEIREYSFDIPPAKKMELKLKSENQNVVFNIYDSNNLITPSPVKNWTAIMVKGGKYKLQIVYQKDKKSKVAADFDLKVIAY